MRTLSLLVVVLFSLPVQADPELKALRSDLERKSGCDCGCGRDYCACLQDCPYILAAKKPSKCPCGCGCTKSCACVQGEGCECGCYEWMSDGESLGLFHRGKQVGYLSPSGVYWELRVGKGHEVWTKTEPPIKPPLDKKTSQKPEWIEVRGAVAVCRS